MKYIINIDNEIKQKLSKINKKLLTYESYDTRGKRIYKEELYIENIEDIIK